MENFDLIIIGGGAGAFSSAIKANELGARTLLVNKGLPLGGTCINVGCVPSKTLLWAGEVMHLANNHGIPGIDIEVKNFDFAQVVQHELDLVAKLRAEKYEKVLSGLEHVTHLEGKAVFVSPNEIKVNGPAFAKATAGRQKYTAKKFIIAAGSTATVPPIDGIKDVGYLTHIEALQIKNQPRELIVVGAGPLGLEFAQMFARFGTKVTILQRNVSIFPPAERELTTQLAEILTKEGITIKTNVQVKSAHLRRGYGGQARKVVMYQEADSSADSAFVAGATSAKEATLVEADEILLATGKTPNTQGLGLDKIGVELNEKQAIKVNSKFQTTQPHIFAVGDVTNLPLRQEPTAGREGTLAAENALNNAQNSIDYSSVPWTIFTDPHLAGVGLTEEQEMKQLGRCLCRTVSFTDVPKAIIMNRTEGLIKMAIHPDTKAILGVHILAPNAGELVAQAVVLVRNKNTIADVVNSLPMFPTLSEAMKITALSFTKDISKLSCCI